MAGIIEYIKWRGDLSLESSPFNPVDNLILSELSYISFTDVVSKNKKNLLHDVAKSYFKLHDKENLGLLLTGEYSLMLKLMARSNRYGNLSIKNCTEIFNEDIEIQFSAMTFELDKHTAYLAFRGTDDTLLGWKEDFQMSFLDVIPSQKEALTYVNNVSKKYKKIYIGGHSKGGNLAVYASIYADKKTKNKIVHTYNNDGPGFKKNILETNCYKDISDRIITFVPQSSVVGMLLEHEEYYRVIKSNQKGLLQHDGFSWQILGSDFEYLTNVTSDSLVIDMTLKNVLNTMDLKQREVFTNILFDIISVNENRTLIDIKKDGLKNFQAMLKKYIGLEKDTKKAISHIVSLFFEEGFRSFLEIRTEEQWKQKILTIKKRFLKDNK